MGDGTTEKGKGGGHLLETFELHAINSKTFFRTPQCRKGLDLIPHAYWELLDSLFSLM